MEAYIVEWLNLLGRWAHLVTGIAWIGASFYFVWLDNHLQIPQSDADHAKGVGGELWAVHGGGFYQAQKYKVAPAELPDTLHWFKWEAYTTFITGFFLLALIYWYQAEIYLVDPQVMPLSKPAAIGIGALTLLGGWLVYDQLCRSALAKREWAIAIILLLLLSVIAWGLCQVFSGRGAFIHFGAMLGSIMVANVFFVIMPGQRDLVAAKEAGRDPDPRHGIRAKQRSVHNTYFTLPVLFVMISNHYAMTYSHAYNWLILIGLSLAGALIRVAFVRRHFGHSMLAPASTAAIFLLIIIYALAPAARTGITDAGSESLDALTYQAYQIVQSRCAGCHHESPSHPGFAAAPAGIQFNRLEDMIAQAQMVHQQTVVTRAMPIGNLTGITEDERQQVDDWFRQWRIQQ